MAERRVLIMAKKIMIVDDDPNIVSYLEDFLGDNGYDTCSASDGSDAMAVVKKENPDLITLDLEMPEEWGPRFYRKLMKENEYKKIPVIVITGLTGGKYAIQKAVASLTKPFDRDELLRIVKDTIG
jgi:DNA-binding response OmpR family regulator